MEANIRVVCGEKEDARKTETICKRVQKRSGWSGDGTGVDAVQSCARPESQRERVALLEAGVGVAWAIGVSKKGVPVEQELERLHQFVDVLKREGQV